MSAHPRAAGAGPLARVLATLGGSAVPEAPFVVAHREALLSAGGGPPHFGRPNLPQPARHYPAGVNLALLPFGADALRHFLFLERPEGMALADAAQFVRPEHLAHSAHRDISAGDIVPQGQDFATVGHLYRSIEAGFDRLASKYGEDGLFIGPP